MSWIFITQDTQPPEDKLVAVSGAYMNNPLNGRWYALARRAGPAYFSDETGDELITPDHWKEIEPVAD